MQRVLQTLGIHRPPAELRGADLVLGDSSALLAARTLLGRIAESGGAPPVPVAVDAGTHASAAAVRLPAKREAALGWLRRAAPRRLILLGDIVEGAALARAVECPVYWINAPGDAAEVTCALLTISNPALQDVLPGAKLTGDPLLGIAELPAPVDAEAALCERFREQHRTGRWILYYAGTGVDEEPIAYGSFFNLARRKMGFLAVAPRDPARYEPVYRDALRYRLPTNRHNRLSTSYVPLATRVYYIENPDTLDAMYGCADVVVAGGTLTAHAASTPDLLRPLMTGKPVLVGPAFGSDPVAAAAVRDGAAYAASDEDALVEAAHALLTDADRRSRLGEHARRWAEAQAGAEERVLDLIKKTGP